MPTFRYDKLVRDNIREMSEDAGHVVDGRELTEEYLLSALYEKFLEEVAELERAIEPDDIASELGDLLQIIYDIAELRGGSIDAAEKARRKKFAKKGGFLKGVYIETVTIPDENDPMIARLRDDPERYPEVKEK